MRESVFTASCICNREKELAQEVKDYETALYQLRGKDWKEGLERDERPPVKLLTKHYDAAIVALKEFRMTEFVMRFAKQ